MKLIGTKLFLAAVVMAVAGSSAWAEHLESMPIKTNEEAVEAAGVDIVGFADAQYVIKDDAGGTTGFALGQVEIDVETCIDDRIDVAVALAYDPEA